MRKQKQNNNDYGPFIYLFNKHHSCSDFMPGNGDKARKVTKIQRNQT